MYNMYNPDSPDCPDTHNISNSPDNPDIHDFSDSPDRYQGNSSAGRHGICYGCTDNVGVTFSYLG